MLNKYAIDNINDLSENEKSFIQSGIMYYESSNETDLDKIIKIQLQNDCLIDRYWNLAYVESKKGCRPNRTIHYINYFNEILSQEYDNNILNYDSDMSNIVRNILCDTIVFSSLCAAFNDASRKLLQMSNLSIDYVIDAITNRCPTNIEEIKKVLLRVHGNNNNDNNNGDNDNTSKNLMINDDGTENMFDVNICHFCNNYLPIVKRKGSILNVCNACLINIKIKHLH